MSAQVSFEQFCKRYELDPAINDSREQYQEYCEKLAALNSFVADPKHTSHKA